MHLFWVSFIFLSLIDPTWHALWYQNNILTTPLVLLYFSIFHLTIEIILKH